MSMFNHWEKDGSVFRCPACEFGVSAPKTVISTYMFCPGCGKQMTGTRENDHVVNVDQVSFMPDQFAKPTPTAKPQRKSRRTTGRSLDDVTINIGEFSPDAYQLVPALDDESDVTTDY